MSAKRLASLLLVFVLLVSACSMKNAAMPEATPDEATLATLHIQLSTALDGWLPSVTSCSNTLPETWSIISQLPTSQLTLEKSDLLLRFGVKSANDAFAAVMDRDALAFISHASLPVASLSIDSMQKIFSGVYTHWQQVPEAASLDVDLPGTIQVWQFGADHDLTLMLQDALLNGNPVGAVRYYAANTSAMLEGVAQNPAAIGYMLRSEITRDVQRITLLDEEMLALPLEQPILAITAIEPEGYLRQFLLCLQNAQ